MTAIIINLGSDELLDSLAVVVVIDKKSKQEAKFLFVNRAPYHLKHNIMIYGVSIKTREKLVY